MPGVAGEENLGPHNQGPTGYNKGVSAGPKVDYVRQEVARLTPLWITIKDAVDGQPAVKSKGDTYLPRPNPEDTSPANKGRYESYLKRAMFYNVTGRTLAGLVGEVFQKETQLEANTEVEKLTEDIDGAGVKLDQQSKKCLGMVMSYGRAGLLVDYPATGGEVTKADVEEGHIRPTISIYQPWDITNWRVTFVGAKSVLSLVVLKEKYVQADDGFEAQWGTQYRVLKLVEGKYLVEIWRPSDQHDMQWSIWKSFAPQTSSGQPWEEIPFQFVGWENNDPEPDNPPLLDLALINIAHYRNSADNEESSFICGQPTPWVAGVSEEWVKGPMKGKLALGSRGGIPLPQGGTAGLLQADPNTMPKDGMEHKERLMVALGARLVQQNEVTRTATEASMENASETSVLGSASKNVSSGYTQALEWLSMFQGVDGNSEYLLSTDFDVHKLDAPRITALMGAYQQTGLSWSELRENFRRAGLTTLTDEEAREENEQDLGLQALAVPPAEGDED